MNKSKKQIRYGVLGCGGHAVDAHGANNNAVSEMLLAGVSDNRTEAMEEYCLKSGTDVPKYLYHGLLLDKRRIDAVLIMTPDEYHPQHLREALLAGLHVMVEKPLAISKGQFEEVDEYLNCAKKMNLVVTSCHPRRFDPPFMWLKKNLKLLIKKLGPVKAFHYDFVYHESTAGWKKRRSLMLDHAGHEIDLVTFIFGRVPFSAEMHDDSFDRYLVTGKREDGIRFSFHGTRRMKERVFLEWATVRFERGEVVVNTDTGYAVVDNFNTNKTSKIFCGPTDYATRSIGVLQNFADAINGIAPNYLTHEDLLLNNKFGVYLLEDGVFTYQG